MKWITVILVIVAMSQGMAQKAGTIHIEQLTGLIENRSDKIQVINFWATWCGPCVKELPLFEALNAQGKADVEVTLVSLDLDLDPNPDKVYKFIERKNLQSKVVLLDERDPNAWIDRIEKDWSGSLPATLIVNTQTGKRIFIAREVHEGELEKLISEIKQIP